MSQMLFLKKGLHIPHTPPAAPPDLGSQGSQGKLGKKAINDLGRYTQPRVRETKAGEVVLKYQAQAGLVVCWYVS